MADNNGRKFISRDDVKFWLALFIVLAGVVAGYSRLQSRVETLAANQQLVTTRLEILNDIPAEVKALSIQQAKIEARLELIDPVLIDLRVNTQAMRTDLQWIREELVKLSNDK